MWAAFFNFVGGMLQWLGPLIFAEQLGESRAREKQAKKQVEASEKNVVRAVEEAQRHADTPATPSLAAIKLRERAEAKRKRKT